MPNFRAGAVSCISGWGIEIGWSMVGRDELGAWFVEWGPIIVSVRAVTFMSATES